MKTKLIPSIIVLLIICGGAVYYLKPFESPLPAEDIGVSAQKEKEPLPEETYEDADSIALYLKNGSLISGRLIREMPNEIIISWEGGDVGFSRAEIERIEYGQVVQKEEGLLFEVEKEKGWEYKNDVVVQMTNRTIIDAKIIAVTPETITIRHMLEEGGAIEQEISRTKVENILFKSVENELSVEVEKNIKEKFPNMQFNKNGLFTIVSDSSNIWIKEYKKILQNHLTDYYLTYFSLLKDRKPMLQHFIVIFDSFNDYADYAITDGVPAWMMPGYFHSLDKTLYMSNSMGDEVSDLLYEILLAKSREVIGEVEDVIKGQINKRYHIFLEGQAGYIKAKLVQIHNIIKNRLKVMTFTILKHEFTHELFHSWGLQTVITSKTKLSPIELSKKKGKYMKTKNIENKRKLLMGLLNQNRDTGEAMEAEAANSWLVEGTATYSETDPIGSISDNWLYVFQEARKNGMIVPLEQLTVYKLGSFPGVASAPKYYAYAQSWAFTFFLMRNYQDEFMKYIEKMVDQKASGVQDITWLLEALGKDLREIENEFLEYMDQFEELESPEMKYFSLVYDVVADY